MASNYILPAWRFFLNYKLPLHSSAYLTKALGHSLVSQSRHRSPDSLASTTHSTTSLLSKHQHLSQQSPYRLGCWAKQPDFSPSLTLPSTSPVILSWFCLLKAFSLLSSWLFPHVFTIYSHHHTVHCTFPAPRVSKCDAVSGKSHWWFPHLSMINKAFINWPSSPNPNPSFTTHLWPDVFANF